jgi:transcriptional regulator with XRE-family HTH domain
MTDTVIHGADLRLEREKAGIKLQDLARRLGVGESLLSRTEAGLRQMDEGLPERYLAEVRSIAKERAEAVGLVVDHPADEVSAEAEAAHL